MSPVGTYWRSSFTTDIASFVVRDDLIFTACHFDKDAHEGDFYTEYDDLMPEELRLFGALLVSTGLDRGFMAQYPDPCSLRLEEKRSLGDENVLADLEARLRLALSKEGKQPPSSTPLPPCSYSYFHLPNPAVVQHEIFAAIDPFDALLIRGLGTLLKAGMLHMHLAFQEEAHYALWVSLDASHSIILDRLRAGGMSNPNSVDAQDFIHDAFAEERSGLKYFEEFYEDRILTMHPKNRFGIFGSAPLGHDDFYWLHNGLRDVYRFLILNKVIDPQGEYDTDEFREASRLGDPNKNPRS